MKNLLFLLALALMLSSCDPYPTPNGTCDYIVYRPKYAIYGSYIENRSDRDVSLSRVYFFSPGRESDVIDMGTLEPETIAKSLPKNTKANFVSMRMRSHNFYSVYKLQVNGKYYFLMPHIPPFRYSFYDVAEPIKKKSVIGAKFFSEMTRDNIYINWGCPILVEDDKVRHLCYTGEYDLEDNNSRNYD